MMTTMTTGYDDADLFYMYIMSFRMTKMFRPQLTSKVKVINYIKFEDKFLKNITKYCVNRAIIEVR